jgi:hypothetical protein
MLWSWLQVLSANAESSINIECLMDDVDVSSELNREQLEEMVAPFLGRLQAVLRSALESSGETRNAVEREQTCGSAVILQDWTVCACMAAAMGFPALCFWATCWTCCGSILYCTLAESSGSILPSHGTCIAAGVCEQIVVTFAAPCN